MKKSHYTENQIMAILQQAAAGIPIPELRRERGVVQPFINSVLNMVGGLFKYSQTKITLTLF